MPPKKQSLSFADLGLSTPLPGVLSKSRAEREREAREAKKDKKQRTKSAMLEVAASRSTIEQHKIFAEKEAQREKKEKEERKRELKIEHAKARNERETVAKEQTRELLASQQRIVAEMKATRAEEEAEARRVKEMIEKETEERAKVTPKNVHISIHRTPEIDAQREGLPVLREEQPIMEAINDTNRTCVLVCGETGSGKTTQVPQFLWEAGYGHPAGATFGREGGILVTEPRRVAAVSMARRVAEELNVEFGKEVCYHVRYDNNLSEDCKLKFATEGIVLKEIQSDFLLKKYSVIVVDEAHERSISCDLLVGLLSRIVPLRNDLFLEELRKNGNNVAATTVKPLKLVIMSATMRVTDFRENATLFPITPPLVSAEARRFPVTNHFARRTELKEYVDQAFDKVRQMHKKLPPGGILVFLCTQQEIEDLCKRLRSHYAKTKIEYYDDRYSKHQFLTGRSEEEAAAASSGDEGEATEETEKDEYGLATSDYALDNGDGAVEEVRNGKPLVPGEPVSKRRRAGKSTPSSAEYGGEDGEGAEEREEEGEINGEFDTLHVLPLYALLDFQKQQEVFKKPPTGKRLCVVATNVAETSITIPNIRYVVDAGRAKSKVIDEETQASCFRIEWTSQASAEQRSGRAGRVGPGHCYRLYSTAVFANLMAKHSVPEMLRTPLDSVVLLMKYIGIEHVGKFPFPSAPREEDLKLAIRHLAVIGALDAAKGFRITPLGRTLVTYPVPPRFARAMAEALQRKLPPRLVEMVAGVVAVIATTSSVFSGEGNRLKASKAGESATSEAASLKDRSEDAARARVKSLVNPGSDFVTYLNALLVYRQQTRQAPQLYCLVQKSMYEANMLYFQLLRLVRQSVAHPSGEDVPDSLDTNETFAANAEDEKPCAAPSATSSTALLSKEEEMTVRQVFIPGLLDQVARRATVQECRSLNVEYNDKRTTRTPYLIVSTRKIAFVHPTSSVSRTYPPPEFLVFGFLQKVVRSETREAQTMMLGVTVVTQQWLDACGFSEDV